MEGAIGDQLFVLAKLEPGSSELARIERFITEDEFKELCDNPPDGFVVGRFDGPITGAYYSLAGEQ